MDFQIINDDAAAWLACRGNKEFDMIITDPPNSFNLYLEFLRVSRNVVMATGLDMLSLDGAHPGAKQVAVYVNLIQALRDTISFDSILDPYMGSGAIGEAALICGLKYIGIERDENWCKLARRRLSLAKETQSSSHTQTMSQCGSVD